MSEARRISTNNLLQQKPQCVTAKNWDRFIRHVVEGETMKAIANEENVSVTAVRGSIYTALRRIKSGGSDGNQGLLRNRRWKNKLLRVKFVCGGCEM